MSIYEALQRSVQRHIGKSTQDRTGCADGDASHSPWTPFPKGNNRPTVRTDPLHSQLSSSAFVSLARCLPRLSSLQQAVTITEKADNRTERVERGGKLAQDPAFSVGGLTAPLPHREARRPQSTGRRRRLLKPISRQAPA